jgi:hypothetical protein
MLSRLNDRNLPPRSLPPSSIVANQAFWLNKLVLQQKQWILDSRLRRIDPDSEHDLTWYGKAVGKYNGVWANELVPDYDTLKTCKAALVLHNGYMSVGQYLRANYSASLIGSRVWYYMYTRDSDTKLSAPKEGTVQEQVLNIDTLSFVVRLENFTHYVDAETVFMLKSSK